MGMGLTFRGDMPWHPSLANLLSIVDVGLKFLDG